MNRPYTRAHIRLNNQNEVIDFISALSKFEDTFVIEDSTGKRRVNAKSVIGVMYNERWFHPRLRGQLSPG